MSNQDTRQSSHRPSLKSIASRTNATPALAPARTVTATCGDGLDGKEDELVGAPYRLLVYVSTASVDITSEDVIEIWRSCDQRNAAAGLRSLLAWNGFNFMQCLEGTPDAVERIMAQIVKDQRHSGVVPTAIYDRYAMWLSMPGMQFVGSQDGLEGLIADPEREPEGLLQEFRQFLKLPHGSRP